MAHYCGFVKTSNGTASRLGDQEGPAVARLQTRKTGLEVRASFIQGEDLFEVYTVEEGAPSRLLLRYRAGVAVPF